MDDIDDRLAGDPVWELFAQPTAGAGHEADRAWPYANWLVAAGLIALGWLKFPPLAVVTVCALVAACDFRKGRLLARSIPSKAGGVICSRFAYAWGAFKLGAAGFAMMFVSVAILVLIKDEYRATSVVAASALLWIGGFAGSAVLTALGLLAAYRSGMRVWIGEGVNRARTLFLGMLLVMFSFAVLGTALHLAYRSISAGPGQSDSDYIPGLLFFSVPCSPAPSSFCSFST